MGNEQHSITTYVSDMLAVERHIRIPFDTQRDDKDVQEYEDASSIVSRLVALSDQHIQTLKACLDGLGGHEASPIKSAVTEFSGFFAGAIDKVRKTKVSKSLRDDYTALALCAVSYSQLLSTANAMGAGDVADIAARHLEDYASAIMEIGETIPGVTVRELQDTDLNVDASTIDQSRQRISQAWQRTSRPFHEPTSTQGSVDAPVRDTSLG